MELDHRHSNQESSQCHPWLSVRNMVPVASPWSWTTATPIRKARSATLGYQLIFRRDFKFSCKLILRHWDFYRAAKDFVVLNCHPVIRWNVNRKFMIERKPLFKANRHFQNG